MLAESKAFSDRQLRNVIMEEGLGSNRNLKSSEIGIEEQMPSEVKGSGAIAE